MTITASPRSISNVSKTFGSLFAGVGGFDIGLESAGWTCGWQVEWDPNCQQVLSYHWPSSPKLWDVCDVDGAQLPPVDVITFGSPCQDLSVAGKRAGLDGGRSGLFFEATRIIKEMRNATGNTFPRWAIWENVVGALSSRGGDDFEAVLREMADLGCNHIEWAVLDAQFFGVPQRRRRVFVIARLDSPIPFRGGPKILSVGEGRARNSAKSKKQGKEPAREVGLSFGDGGEWGRSEVTEVESYTASSFGGYAAGIGTVRANGGDAGGGSETLVISNQLPHALNDGIAPTLRSGGDGGVPSSRGEHLVIVTEDPDEILLIDGRRNDDVRVTTEPVRTLEARMGTGGNNVPYLAIPIQDGRGMEKKQNGLGIGSAGDVSYTLDQTGGQSVAVESYDEFNDSLGGDVHHSLRAGTRQSTGVVIPTMSVRRLTPVECERLMGWPDNHTLYRADGKLNTDTIRYKMCGNGVASPVAKWIAEQINLCE